MDRKPFLETNGGDLNKAWFCLINYRNNIDASYKLYQHHAEKDWVTCLPAKLRNTRWSGFEPGHRRMLFHARSQPSELTFASLSGAHKTGMTGALCLNYRFCFASLGRYRRELRDRTYLTKTNTQYLCYFRDYNRVLDWNRALNSMKNQMHLTSFVDLKYIQNLSRTMKALDSKDELNAFPIAMKHEHITNLSGLNNNINDNNNKIVHEMFISL